MSVREWAVPVLLAVAVAAAVWAWDPERPVVERDLEPVWVFAEGPVAAEPRPVMAVSEARQGGTTVLDLGHGLEQELVWITPHVGLAVATYDRYQIRCITEPCPVLEGPTVRVPPEEGAPRALVDGDVVRATVHVFDEEGLLLATNALEEQDRFTVRSDMLAIPGDAWYLGEGQPPNGSQRVPLFGDLVRQLVEGEVPGGHRAQVFEQHPARNLYGTVYVSARVDAVLEG